MTLNLAVTSSLQRIQKDNEEGEKKDDGEVEKKALELAAFLRLQRERLELNEDILKHYLSTRW